MAVILLKHHFRAMLCLVKIFSRHTLDKIGYTIRFYRRARSLSQIDMAELVGMSHRNLQRVECGEVEPKLETLQSIARVLDVPIASLIRPTDSFNLQIKEVTSTREMNSFFELDARVAVTQDDLNFAQSVILKDQWRPFQMDASCMAKIEYNRASFTQKLAVDFGLPDNNNNLDLYNIDGTSAERWEFLYRAKISSALIQNFYVFPNGFRAIESYHPNISLNPDAPISECYVQDVTSRHELEQWLQKNVSSKTFVY